MIHLSVEQIEPFLDRFNRCEDGVVRRLEITGPWEASDEITIKIMLRVADKDQSEFDWLTGTPRIEPVDRHIEIHDLKELGICKSQGHATRFVLSPDGLRITKSCDLFYLEFGDCLDEPSAVEEFRTSKFYLAGREVSWEVSLPQ